MNALITPQSKLLIQLILTDSKISERVFENLKDKSKYKICTINNDGTIVMGKTGIRWWNALLNCQDVLSFESFALKIWDSLVDLSSGLNNEAILNGLSKEIVMRSVRLKDYNWVVNRLYDCYVHVAQHTDGYAENHKTEDGKVSPEGDWMQNQDRVQPQKTIEKPREIVINIEGMKKVIPFQDSIGDPINLGVVYGITRVEKI